VLIVVMGDDDGTDVVAAVGILIEVRSFEGMLVFLDGIIKVVLRISREVRQD
jgi:hypothetical protein